MCRLDSHAERDKEATSRMDSTIGTKKIKEKIKNPPESQSGRAAFEDVHNLWRN